MWVTVTRAGTRNQNKDQNLWSEVGGWRAVSVCIPPTSNTLTSTNMVPGTRVAAETHPFRSLQAGWQDKLSQQPLLRRT